MQHSLASGDPPEPTPSVAAVPNPVGLRGVRSLTLAAFAVAVIGDRLFVGATLGVNAAIFSLALLVVIFAWRIGQRRRFGSKGTIILLALLLLIASLAVEPGYIAAALVAGLLWSLARGATGRWPERLVELVGDVIAWPAALLRRLVADGTIARRWINRHGFGRTGRWLARLLLWGVPSLVAATFIVLFGFANPVIEQWLRELLDAARDAARWVTADVTPGRIVIWLACAFGTWGLLRGRGRQRGRVSREGGEPTSFRALLGGSADGLVSPLVVKRAFLIRTLLLCNLVFLVQTSLDFTYLSGGSRLPQGMSFAQYAHRGAYPLIAATLLAGLFTLCTFRPGGDGERSPWARRLVSVWIAQNILLTMTAAWRLWLYVDQYSLSRWRLATVVWLVIVAAGLVMLIERIRRRASFEWFVGRAAAATTAILALLIVPDIDGLIARYNVAHCREVGHDAVPIDLDYLDSLGEAALPAFHELAATSRDPDIAAEATVRAARLRHEVDATLADWRSWTVRRATR